jgi:hypothetical protein
VKLHVATRCSLFSETLARTCERGYKSYAEILRLSSRLGQDATNTILIKTEALIPIIPTMSHDAQAALISASVKDCLIAFEKCLSKASQAGLGVYQYSSLENQMARFSIWTSNMAVFDTGKSCLEHHLREAKDIRRWMLGMLEVLNDQISECASVLIVPWSLP